MKRLDLWKVTDQPSHIDRKETGANESGSSRKPVFPKPESKENAL